MKRTGLRIGVVVPRFAPFHGGVETYTARAAAALAGAGAEVTIVTQVPRRTRLPFREELPDGYTVERHLLPIGESFDLPSPSAARSAWRFGRFDVVWVHNYHTPLALLAAARAAAPVVLTPHYHGAGRTRLRTALHRVYRPAGGHLMATSHRILPVTDAEANLVLRDFPGAVRRDKVSVVPLAVADPVRGRRPYSTDLPAVLTVARQEPYKRTDLLIRAIVELRRRAVPARLVVVGAGSALAANRRLVAELGAQTVVTFTGPVDEETLGRWWASASLYATASTQEAFGISLAEALVAGLPVVASDIASHREVVERAGPSALAELCPAEESDTDAVSRIADAMERLLAVPASTEERAARCALPTAARMAGQLLESFTAVTE